MSRRTCRTLIGVAVLLLLGCAPRLIPQELEREVDPDLTLREVRKDADLHLGKRLLLGGEIIAVHPKSEGSEIELLEKPLDSNRVPLPVDASEGRFILIHPGSLDLAQFKSGRRITLIGKVVGTRRLGEEQAIPVLESTFLHAWPPQGRSFGEPALSIGFGFGAVFGR
jgi:outer membrane lipoprotein